MEQNNQANPITVTGVILAGGLGRRLQNRDKGLVEVNGKCLVEYVIERLQPQVDTLILNANRNQEIYKSYGLDVISDEIEGFQGPLAGFATAMSLVKTDCILTVPCDGPLLPHNLRERLQAALLSSGKPIAVAHSRGRLQPVYALLKTELLPALEDYLSSDQRKIDTWYAEMGMAEVDFSDAPECFLNINREEDMREISGLMKP